MASTKIRTSVPESGTRMTRHAQQRSAQRGIRQLQIDLINCFGVDHLQKGGEMLCFMQIA